MINTTTKLDGDRFATEITVETIAQLYTLVNITMNSVSGMVAKQDGYIVNAASVMGLCCLDLTRPFTVECDAATTCKLMEQIGG